MSAGALGVALVGGGLATALHRAAWSAAEAWTGVATRVIVETPCWRQAMSLPGVDVVDLCGSAADGSAADPLGAAAAAASAGRHIVIGDLSAVRGRPASDDTPPSWALGAGGWTVVDLPHRCVPAVSLAREIVASGDIGVPRHVRVRGAASLAVVDLVHTLTGRRFAAATHAPDRGRLDGLLDGGCTVAVRADGPGRDAADVRVEVSGSDGSVHVDLQRPLTVEVSADDREGRLLRAPLAPHPYPAVFGPPDHPCRARMAAEHLVVDVVEAVTRGREDVPCLGDVLEASWVLSQGVDTGGAVSPRAEIEGPAPAQLVRA